MLWVTRRWHFEPSKNFLPARYVKLAAAHGALAVSTLILMVPTLVSMVMVWAPVRGSPVAGGVPTSFTSLGISGAGDIDGSTSGSQVQLVGAAEADEAAEG